MDLKIVLLAAGKSERFNGIKQLARVDSLNTSHPLIIHTLSNLKLFSQLTQSSALANSNQDSIYVASGVYHRQLTINLDASVNLHYCENAHLGMGSTIAEMVNFVESDAPSTSHILLCLVDQVALMPADYAKLYKQALFNPTKLICGQSEVGISAPAIFPKQYFSHLKQLSGDKGAKSILHHHQNNLIKVAMPNAEFDIDTQEDLAKWNSSELNLKNRLREQI